MVIKAIYLWINEQAEGPYTFAQLTELFRQGRITRETLYATDGMKTWDPLGDIWNVIDPPLWRPSQQTKVPQLPIPLNHLAHEDKTRIVTHVASNNATVLELIASIFIFGGLAAVGYFMSSFDPSVPGSRDIERVSNLSRMHFQQNSIIAGTGATIFGALLLILDRLNKIAFPQAGK